MIHKRIETITLEDIQQVFDNAERESKTLEFKRELKIGKDADKKEFLADISSFANSAGGDLIFGIDEKKGLVGIEVESIDGLIQQVEQIIRGGIKPHLTNFQIQEFSIGENKYLLLLRIPKSFNAPHQVSFNESDKFYARGESGKFKLDVYRLREAFIGSEEIKKRINDFLQSRIAEILSGETPVLIPDNPKLIFHVVPIPSFSQNKRHLTYPIEQREVKLFPPGTRSDYGLRINFDGVVTYFDGQQNKKQSYSQFFRNGVVESVSTSCFSIQEEKRFIPSTVFEEALYLHAGRTLQTLKSLQIDFPVIMLLSLVGVKGCWMATSLGRSLYSEYSLEKDYLRFDEIFLESESEAVSSAKIVKSWLDDLWRAFGYEYCHDYNSQGMLRLNGNLYT